MTRWKRIALSSVAAGVLVGGGWVWLKEASAALPGNPPGTVIRCKGDKSHLLQVNGGPGLNAVTSGFIDATVGQSSTTSDGRLTTQLTVNGTNTQGYIDGVGTLVISMDKSRAVPPSSLTANQRGSAFPATQTMRFFPVLTLNGEAFTSATPVQVVSSSVTSFPPQRGTVYVLTNAVVLKSAEGNEISLEPGKAFTITG